MAINDTLAAVLSCIQNAEKAGKKECLTRPASRLIIQVLTILQNHHYLGEVEQIPDGKSNLLNIRLLGSINRCNVIKPRYPFKKVTLEKYEKRFLPAKGFGCIIVSTSQGVMDHEQARNQNLGGRMIAYCY